MLKVRTGQGKGEVHELFLAESLLVALPNVFNTAVGSFNRVVWSNPQRIQSQPPQSFTEE